MSLLAIVVVLFVIGLLMWALNQFPIDAMIKKIIYVVVVVFVVIWLLQSFGLLGAIGDIRIK
jgi:uncharacterized membrane protein YwzB